MIDYREVHPIPGDKEVGTWRDRRGERPGGDWK
jgi:hypothetical protein